MDELLAYLPRALAALDRDSVEEQRKNKGTRRVFLNSLIATWKTLVPRFFILGVTPATPPLLLATPPLLIALNSGAGSMSTSSYLQPKALHQVTPRTTHSHSLSLTLTNSYSHSLSLSHSYSLTIIIGRLKSI